MPRTPHKLRDEINEKKRLKLAFIDTLNEKKNQLKGGFDNNNEISAHEWVAIETQKAYIFALVLNQS